MSTTKYKVTIEEIVTTRALKEVMITGAQAEECCKLTGVKMQKDWQDKQYVNVMMPEDVKTTVEIYKQTVDQMDLGRLVLMLNESSEKAKEA